MSGAEVFASPTLPPSPSVRVGALVAPAGELHDRDLKIPGVDCHPGMSGRYTCEVGFAKTDYDRTRVFLDAALVERGASNDRTLLRGLVADCCDGKAAQVAMLQ